MTLGLVGSAFFQVPNNLAKKQIPTFPTKKYLYIPVGVAVGAVASFIDIGTTWMTDLKYGICPEAFWFDREQCCWSSNQTTFSDNCSQVNEAKGHSLKISILF